MSGSIQIWGAGSTRRQVEQGVLLEYERVASTMDVARAQLLAGDSQIAGVRSEYQSAGRGRLGATWIAPPGACLLITYVVPAGIDPDFARNLSFAAGVAVAEAIERVCDISPRLKWPNDVLLSGKKVAGVLVESGTTRQPRPPFLVGVGLNVNVDRFPEDLAPLATSLELETGLLHDILEIETGVRRNLFATAYQPWEEILRCWRARDDTAGRTFLATGPTGGIPGLAVGVTDEGLLRLETQSGTKDVLSATSAVKA